MRNPTSSPKSCADCTALRSHRPCGVGDSGRRASWGTADGAPERCELPRVRGLPHPRGCLLAESSTQRTGSRTFRAANELAGVDGGSRAQHGDETEAPLPTPDLLSPCRQPQDLRAHGRFTVMAYRADEGSLEDVRIGLGGSLHAYDGHDRVSCPGIKGLGALRLLLAHQSPGDHVSADAHRLLRWHTGPENRARSPRPTGWAF